AVPEAPVHENRFLAGGEDEVRTTGKRLGMETKAIAQRVQRAPDCKFGAGILLPNRLHDPPTLFWRSCVHLKSPSTVKLPQPAASAYSRQPSRSRSAGRERC